MPQPNAPETIPMPLGTPEGFMLRAAVGTLIRGKRLFTRNSGSGGSQLPTRLKSIKYKQREQYNIELVLWEIKIEKPLSKLI